jgi:formate-dependent nitrite reductase cytochrome c552 subunit
MYCPKCKAEYRPGITVCADCGVPLVYELPKEEPKEKHEIGPNARLVELLATFNHADIAIIKSILDDAGIEYYFKGDHTIMTRPYVDPARLLVKKGQVDEVKDLLKDLNLKYHVSFSDNQEE